MLLRAILGFALLVTFVALGTRVARQRSGGRRPWRDIAGGIDRAVGLLAVAFLAVLAIGVLRLVL